MRNKFNIQLEKLHDEIILMGTMCERAITLAVEAFFDKNQESIETAIQLEKEIDDKEKEIERACLKLLLHQQPVASDLRIVSASLKMITDIERIGDQARDIAHLASYQSDDNKPSPTVSKMAQEVVYMVNRAIESFVKNDTELAESVIAYDDIVDKLFKKVRTDIITEIKEESISGEKAIDILMVAKYLERIADHATNIAEWVEFLVTGEHA